MQKMDLKNSRGKSITRWRALAASCLLACSTAIAEPVTTQANALSRAERWTAFNCKLSPINNGFDLLDIESQPVLQTEVDCDSGAMIIEFELRANVPAGDHYVNWATDSDSGWDRFIRIPIQLGGEWNHYRLPLNANGKLRAIRFAFSTSGGEVSLRNLKLTTAIGSQKTAESTGLKFETEALLVQYDLASRCFKVKDARTGRDWKSTAITRWAVVEEATATSSSIDLRLRSRFSGKAVSMSLVSDQVDALTFLISPEDTSDRLEGLEDLVPRFSTNMQSSALIFCDRSSGVLLDQRDNTYGAWPLRVYGNTHCLDMPWIGCFDRKNGDGLMCVFDTPNDAEVGLVADEAGRNWPQPRWLPSRDRFGYTRKLSLHFMAEGGYVAQAARYRALAMKSGLLKPLSEKAEAIPEVERLRGAASVWTTDRYFANVREAHSLGMHRAVLSNIRRSQNSTWIKNLGMLVGRYDSYSDIFEGPTGFQRDRIQEVAVRARPGATPLDGWTMDDGAQMSWRSTARWLTAAKQYVPEQLAKTGHNSRFVDVAVAAKLDEDYSPDHSYDRSEDLRLRRELFSYLREFGVVLGTEHGNDWAADLIDYHEGSLSGPYWWSSWEAGRLRPPRRDQLSANYLKFGVDPSQRIPLWQLVYHDCLISTPYWGDTAGMLHHAAPEIADRKDLFTLLYGGAPLLWLAEPDKGYGWDANRWRWLRTYHDTTHFLKRNGFARMLSHEQLTPDALLQRSVFEDGASVVVNFSDSPRPDPSEDSVMIAPGGYRAKAPGYTQEKTWVDGQAVTRIECDDFKLFDASMPRTYPEIQHQGRIYAFPTEGGSWTVVGEPQAWCHLNVARLTGWDDATVYRMCPIRSGEVLPATAQLTASEPTPFPALPEGWAYALVPVDDPPAAVTASAEAHP